MRHSRHAVAAPLRVSVLTRRSISIATIESFRNIDILGNDDETITNDKLSMDGNTKDHLIMSIKNDNDNSNKSS